MQEPDIAATKPCLVTLKRKGRTYFWCSCGKSKKQPFCDGSHMGTGFEPLAYMAKEDDEEVLLCACKRTRSAPFCDGSHNSLSDGYEEASEAERAASAHIPITEPDASGKAVLDGGCFVLHPEDVPMENIGDWRIGPAITAKDGADFLSQYLLFPGVHAQPLSFGESEAAIYVFEGSGNFTIADQSFDAGPETGLYIRPNEAFTAQQKGTAPLILLAVICPTGPRPQIAGTNAREFDERFPNRVMPVDPAKRQSMADRFYQVLVGEDCGSNQITQFIGEVPKSRAAAHRHLYEETITILSGEGYMWTENARAKVKAGDMIFLPKKQLHSLECTDDSGMRLMGAFYPAGSPAINY